MTTRKILPYILVIVTFELIFWLTTITPEKIIYSILGQDLDEIKNIRIPIQVVIFTFILTFVILGINILEILTTQKDKYLFRLIKSISTIILTYLFAFVIIEIIGNKTRGLFYSHRGIPAINSFFLTIIMTVTGVIILEFVKRSYLIHYYKSTLSKYIPKWLIMESKSHQQHF